MEETYLGKDSAIYKRRQQQRKIEMSPVDLRKSKYGEKHQGEGLVSKKFKSQTNSSLGHTISGSPSPVVMQPQL